MSVLCHKKINDLVIFMWLLKQSFYMKQSWKVSYKRKNSLHMAVPIRNILEEGVHMREGERRTTGQTVACTVEEVRPLTCDGMLKKE